MRFSLLLVIICSYVMSMSAQDLEVSGKAKIGTMIEDNTVDSVVVKQSDGTLAVRHISSLSELQILSISNDTIFLTNGGFVKLPVDNVKTTNELQNINRTGSTVTL